MALEYIIYADESTKKSAFFSNFYGGALVRSTDLELVRRTLEEAKTEQNLLQEIKWSKVTEQYLKKYQAVMEVFFRLVAEDKVKIRIMFTQNALVPKGLNAYHRENEFFILYYEFLKHAFGLGYCNPTDQTIGLRIYLDKLPDTAEKVEQFRAYLVALNKSHAFVNARVQVRADQIAEVNSHDHVILQCLDVVLGSMFFRLNDLHKVKPEGARQRGKRTIAKEKLYRAINGHICSIYPNFNIGISTGVRGDKRNYWLDSYRHWKLEPGQYEVDKTKYKR